MTSQRSLDPSQPVYIRLPGLQSLGANVKWEGFKDYGCQFIHALNPNVFENLVSKLKTLKNVNE